MAARRVGWRQQQPGLDPGRLIFLDETWAKTNMTRLRGRAPVGQRLIDRIPHGHWKTTPLIAALDVRGIRCSTVVDGAANADGFEAFVKQVLHPTLRPGDIVILDNLSSHKRQRTGERIRSAGAELWFLPPYSPDLNPIENVFSKIKRHLAFPGLRVSPDALGRHAGRARSGQHHRCHPLLPTLRLLATCFMRTPYRAHAQRRRRRHLDAHGRAVQVQRKWIRAPGGRANGG